MKMLVTIMCLGTLQVALGCAQQNEERARQHAGVFLTAIGVRDTPSASWRVVREQPKQNSLPSYNVFTRSGTINLDARSGLVLRFDNGPLEKRRHEGPSPTSRRFTSLAAEAKYVLNVARAVGAPPGARILEQAPLSSSDTRRTVVVGMTYGGLPVFGAYNKASFVLDASTGEVFHFSQRWDAIVEHAKDRIGRQRAIALARAEAMKTPRMPALSRTPSAGLGYYPMAFEITKNGIEWRKPPYRARLCWMVAWPEAEVTVDAQTGRAFNVMTMRAAFAGETQMPPPKQKR